MESPCIPSVTRAEMGAAGAIRCAEACQPLQEQVIQDAEDDRSRSLLALKQELLSRNHVVKQYMAKCQELDSVTKCLEETRRNMDEECRSLESRLKLALEELLPLKKTKSELESANRRLVEANSSLEEQLASTKASCDQFSAMVKVKDVEIGQLKEAKSELGHELHSVKERLRKHEKKESGKAQKHLLDLHAARTSISDLKKQLKTMNRALRKTDKKLSRQLAAPARQQTAGSADNLAEEEEEQLFSDPAEHAVHSPAASPLPPSPLSCQAGTSPGAAETLDNDEFSLEDILRDVSMMTVVSPLCHQRAAAAADSDAELETGNAGCSNDDEFDSSLDDFVREVEMHLSTKGDVVVPLLTASANEFDESLLSPSGISVPGAHALVLPPLTTSATLSTTHCTASASTITVGDPAEPDRDHAVLPFASFTRKSDHPIASGSLDTPLPAGHDVPVDQTGAAVDSSCTAGGLSRRLEVARRERLLRRARARGVLSASDAGLCVRRSERSRPQAPLARLSAVDDETADDEEDECSDPSSNVYVTAAAVTASDHTRIEDAAAASSSACANVLGRRSSCSSRADMLKQESLGFEPAPQVADCGSAATYDQPAAQQQQWCLPIVPVDADDAAIPSRAGDATDSGPRSENGTMLCIRPADADSSENHLTDGEKSSGNRAISMLVAAGDGLSPSCVVGAALVASASSVPQDRPASEVCCGKKIKDDDGHSSGDAHVTFVPLPLPADLQDAPGSTQAKVTAADSGTIPEYSRCTLGMPPVGALLSSCAILPTAPSHQLMFGNVPDKKMMVLAGVVCAHSVDSAAVENMQPAIVPVEDLAVTARRDHHAADYDSSADRATAPSMVNESLGSSNSPPVSKQCGIITGNAATVAAIEAEDPSICTPLRGTMLAVSTIVDDSFGPDLSHDRGKAKLVTGSFSEQHPSQVVGTCIEVTVDETIGSAEQAATSPAKLEASTLSVGPVTVDNTLSASDLSSQACVTVACQFGGSDVDQVAQHVTEMVSDDTTSDPSSTKHHHHDEISRAAKISTARLVCAVPAELENRLPEAASTACADASLLISGYVCAEAGSSAVDIKPLNSACVAATDDVERGATTLLGGACGSKQFSPSTSAIDVCGGDTADDVHSVRSIDNQALDSVLTCKQVDAADIHVATTIDDSSVSASASAVLAAANVGSISGTEQQSNRTSAENVYLATDTATQIDLNSAGDKHCTDGTEKLLNPPSANTVQRDVSTAASSDTVDIHHSTDTEDRSCSASADALRHAVCTDERQDETDVGDFCRVPGMQSKSDCASTSANDTYHATSTEHTDCLAVPNEACQDTDAVEQPLKPLTALSSSASGEGASISDAAAEDATLPQPSESARRVAQRHLVWVMARKPSVRGGRQPPVSICRGVSPVNDPADLAASTLQLKPGATELPATPTQQAATTLVATATPASPPVAEPSTPTPPCILQFTPIGSSTNTVRPALPAHCPESCSATELAAAAAPDALPPASSSLKDVTGSSHNLLQTKGKQKMLNCVVRLTDIKPSESVAARGKAQAVVGSAEAPVIGTHAHSDNSTSNSGTVLSTVVKTVLLGSSSPALTEFHGVNDTKPEDGAADASCLSSSDGSVDSSLPPAHGLWHAHTFDRQACNAPATMCHGTPSVHAMATTASASDASRLGNHGYSGKVEASAGPVADTCMASGFTLLPLAAEAAIKSDPGDRLVLPRLFQLAADSVVAPVAHKAIQPLLPRQELLMKREAPVDVAVPAAKRRRLAAVIPGRTERPEAATPRSCNFISVAVQTDDATSFPPVVVTGSSSCVALPDPSATAAAKCRKQHLGQGSLHPPATVAPSSSLSSGADPWHARLRQGCPVDGNDSDDSCDLFIDDGAAGHDRPAAAGSSVGNCIRSPLSEPMPDSHAHPEASHHGLGRNTSAAELPLKHDSGASSARTAIVDGTYPASAAAVPAVVTVTASRACAGDSEEAALPPVSVTELRTVLCLVQRLSPLPLSPVPRPGKVSAAAESPVSAAAASATLPGTQTPGRVLRPRANRSTPLSAAEMPQTSPIQARRARKRVTFDDEHSCAPAADSIHQAPCPIQVDMATAESDGLASTRAPAGSTSKGAGCLRAPRSTSRQESQSDSAVMDPEAAACAVQAAAPIVPTPSAQNRQASGAAAVEAASEPALPVGKDNHLPATELAPHLSFSDSADPTPHHRPDYATECSDKQMITQSGHSHPQPKKKKKKKQRKIFTDERAANLTLAESMVWRQQQQQSEQQEPVPIGEKRQLVSYAGDDDPFCDLVICEDTDVPGETDDRSDDHSGCTGGGSTSTLPARTKTSAALAAVRPAVGARKMKKRPAVGAHKMKKQKGKKKNKGAPVKAAAGARLAPPVVPQAFELPHENQVRYADSELRRYMLDTNGSAMVQELVASLIKVVKKPAVLLESIVKVLAKSQEDLVATLSSQCETGSFAPPMHTQCESKIILLLHFASQTMSGLYQCAIETFAGAVVDSSISDVTVLGRSALCRLCATVCKMSNARARARALVDDVLTSGLLAFPALIVAIASCWPDVLQCTGDDDLQCRVYERVVMQKLKADASKHTMFKQMLGILQKLCKWSTDSVSPTSLCSGIVARVRTTSRYAERNSLLRLVRLVASCEPWSWVKVDLISNTVWPLLKCWALSVIKTDVQLPVDSGITSDLMCDLIGLVGTLCQRCPLDSRDGTTFVPDVMFTLLEILLQSMPADKGSQQSARADVPWDVLTCTIEVLLSLAPYRPSLVARACQSWVRPNFARIEHRIMASVQSFWHTYGSNAAAAR